jgi:alpha-D-xyloside xylohydrolase
VDYWSGVQTKGGRVVVVDAAVDKIPVWVRAGAVIPKIPEDVMTLVPQSESGNSAVKSLDDRRVYEINDDGGGSGTIADFEGRSVARSGKTLKITGDSAAQVIVRWRFARPKSVTVDGKPAKMMGGDGFQYVEFDHLKDSVVAWQ